MSLGDYQLLKKFWQAVSPKRIGKVSLAVPADSAEDTVTEPSHNLIGVNTLLREHSQHRA